MTGTIYPIQGFDTQGTFQSSSAQSLQSAMKVEDDGGVVFVSKGGAIRLPVKAALKHKFLRQVSKS